MSIPFFSSSILFPSPVIAPPLFHPFSFLLLFPSPLKFSSEVWSSSHTAQRKKWKPVAEVGGDQIHLFPVISVVGGDASLRVVASVVVHRGRRSV